MWVVRLIGDNIPLVISLSGIHDKRISLNEIPWSDLVEIADFGQRGTSLIKLRLSSDGKNRLKLNLYQKIISNYVEAHNPYYLWEAKKTS